MSADEVRDLLIWVPYELFIAITGAIYGWPFKQAWPWIFVGWGSWILYEIRKELML